AAGWSGRLVRGCWSSWLLRGAGCDGSDEEAWGCAGWGFPAGRVVVEEDLADQFAAGPYAGLFEDGLEGVLHGVGRHRQRLGDLLRGPSPDALHGHLRLTVGQAVGERD